MSMKFSANDDQSLDDHIMQSLQKNCHNKRIFKGEEEDDFETGKKRFI